MKIEPVAACADSVKNTLNRVLPHWNEDIMPKLR
jgi:bisphosphoglycerate-dependent phosphoglycerate mutase